MRLIKNAFSKGFAAPLALLLSLSILFTVIDPVFANPRNLYAIGQAFALLGLVALGLSLTMIAGEFDLSIGSMVAVGGLVTLTAGEGSLLVGFLSALAIGALVGLINSGFVILLRASSLVVTVGSMIVLSGVAFLLAAGRVLTTDNFEPGFVLDDPIWGIFSWRSLVTIVIFLCAALMLNYTRLGRDIRVVGSHRAMARAAGARVGLSLTASFVASSLCGAMAGALLAISLASASAVTGSNLLLQAASAAIVGGVAISGGAGTPLGVALGAMVLVTLNSGLGLLGFGTSTTAFANGLLLLLVVLLDGRAGRRLKTILRTRRGIVPLTQTRETTKEVK